MADRAHFVVLFSSRTGRYERAHVLSSLALTGLVMIVALPTGGIASFAASGSLLFRWKRRCPHHAVSSPSPRCCVSRVLALIATSYFNVLPAADAGGAAHSVLCAFGIVSAMLYAAGWRSAYEFADAHRLLAAVSSRKTVIACWRATCATSFRVTGAMAPCCLFRRPRKPCLACRWRNCRTMVCSTASTSLIARPISPRSRRAALGKDAQSVD